MRLTKYLSLSSDNDTSLFRSLQINLVESDTSNIDIVNKIDNVIPEVSSLLDKANKELKSIYRGKMKFDLCLEEEGSTPDEVRMDKSKLPKVKELWFELNNDLSEIQSSFEKYLSTMK